MVAHPEHGVAVRKLYDPRGISSQDMIARKEQAGRAVGDSPHFAKFLGSAQTPQGGQMHFNEYVQAGKAPTGQAGAQSIRHTQVQAQRALHNAGYAGGKDIRGSNMIYDQNTGTHKVIDYIPAQKGEFMRMPKKMDHVISPNETSANLFNLENDGTNSTAPGMLNRLLGSGGRPGGVRSNDSTALAGPSTAVARPRPSVSPSENATALQRPAAKPAVPPPQPPPTRALQPQKPAAPATAVAKPKPVSGLAPVQQ